MARGRWHPSSCKHCGVQAEEGVPISATGQCPDCGDRNMLANIHGLVSHSGPAFRRWREGMAASVGALLLDERPDEG